MPSSYDFWKQSTLTFSYRIESEDGNTFYLKCKGGGAAVSLTERAVVLGTWVEGTPVTGPICNDIIEEVSKHLRAHKYWMELGVVVF